MSSINNYTLNHKDLDKARRRAGYYGAKNTNETLLFHAN